jgi:hypothetical protein
MDENDFEDLRRDYHTRPKQACRGRNRPVEAELVKDDDDDEDDNDDDDIMTMETRSIFLETDKIHYLH